MISRFLIAVVFFALGVGATYYGLSHHVVRTEEKVLAMPKLELAIAETYVDIREWTSEDFSAHPAVTEALIRHGHQALIPNRAIETLGDKIKDVIGEILIQNESL